MYLMSFIGNWIRALTGKGGNQQAYVNEGQIPVQIPGMDQQPNEINQAPADPNAQTQVGVQPDMQNPSQMQSETQQPNPFGNQAPGSPINAPQQIQGLPAQPQTSDAMQVSSQEFPNPFTSTPQTNPAGPFEDTKADELDSSDQSSKPASGPTGMPINPTLKDPQNSGV
jgi:hypothetical protein